MKIKKTFILLFAFIITSMIVIAIIIILLFNNHKILIESDNLRDKSMAIAKELRQSSDDLTNYCCLYIMSGDTTFEAKYRKILQIRNGQYPRCDGRQISLNDSMQKLSFTEQELDLLKTSETISNNLVCAEKAAFNAIKGKFADSSGNYSITDKPNFMFAQKILFDEKYRHAKHNIIQPIDKFITQLDNRTKNTVNYYTRKSYILLFVLFSLILIVIVISFISYFLINKKIEEQLIAEKVLKEKCNELAIAKGKAEESEERYSQMVNNDLFPVVVTAFDGNLLFANHCTAVFLELEINEILKFNAAEIWANPDKRNEYINDIKTKGFVRNKEVEFRTTQNIIKTAILSSSPISYYGQQAILTIYNDITEQKKTEILLNKLQTAITNLKASIIITDTEGNIEYANPYFSQITGYKKEDYLEKNSRFLKSNYYGSDYYKKMWDTIKSGKTWESDFYNCKKNGESHWENVIISPVINADQKIINFVTIKTDISDRKKSEKALLAAKEKAEESEANFRLLIENAPHAIFIQTEYKFSYLNKMALNLYGAETQDQMVGSKIIDRIHPDYRDIVSQRIKNVNENKIYSSNLEFKHLKLDNTPIEIESSSVPFFYENKHGALVFVRDITDRKRAEETLIIAKEKAEESDRLKTAFLNNMSHEIRTPMNAIIGFSEMLNNPDLSVLKRQNYVSIINESSYHLQSIVEDILAISSLETKQEKTIFQSFCINDILDNLYTIFNIQANNKNISLSLKKQLPDEQSEIFTDKNKIIKILKNLISNALKFTDTGMVEFGCNLKDPDIEFYVKDSGIGIDPEMQQKIFERFTQVETGLNRQYDGNGLGLSIAKGFVELLGGRIWVESEIEKGASFYFTIPYKSVDENKI